MAVSVVRSGGGADVRAGRDAGALPVAGAAVAVPPAGGSVGATDWSPGWAPVPASVGGAAGDAEMDVNSGRSPCGAASVPHAARARTMTMAVPAMVMKVRRRRRPAGTRPQ